MFSIMELRLIRHAVHEAMKKLQDQRATLDPDPESDEAYEAPNDLMIYQNIVEKIDEREDV